MTSRIRLSLLVATFLRTVQMCNSCLTTGDVKVITMCTSGSITGSPILLTTTNTDVNTCICAIEVNSGEFVITILGRPNSSDCGTRIDITNNNGSVSTTFQCQQSELRQGVAVSITSGYITLRKQSNSTEDDIGYCLSLTGSEFTINCYGNDSQPPTTSTKEATSSTTIINSITTSRMKIPTTAGLLSTRVASTTQLPQTTTSTSSYGASLSTTTLTMDTTNHQGNNTSLTIGRKTYDTNLAVIIPSTLGAVCVIAVIIIIVLVCQRHIRNRGNNETRNNEKNKNCSTSSFNKTTSSGIDSLNNGSTRTVPECVDGAYFTNFYENIRHHQDIFQSGSESVSSKTSNEQNVGSNLIKINKPEPVRHNETGTGNMYTLLNRSLDLEHPYNYIVNEPLEHNSK